MNRSFDENRSKKFRKKPASSSETTLVRLNKYIANAGICSRREADTLISKGLIKVNGKVLKELGAKIDPRKDKVSYHDEVIAKERPVYLLLNKPKNFITTAKDPQGRKTVIDLIKNACPERLYPVGRLDRDTTGVLLFTNDGELADKLTHPSCNISKLYHVQTADNVSNEDIEKLRKGITLEDGFIKPDEIALISSANTGNEIGIQLHSGKNRIVRRMIDHIGHKVVKLDRVLFAGLSKKNLPRGKWRFLKQSEVNILKRLPSRKNPS